MADMAKDGHHYSDIGVLIKVMPDKAGSFYQLVSDGIYGDAQVIGDFLVGEALHFTHSEDALPLGGQLGNSGHFDRLQLPGVEDIVHSAGIFCI